MMKRVLAFSVILACPVLLLLAPQASHAGKRVERQVRFAPVHIYLDSGGKPLAAYQFELKATSGRIKIVGIEGGEHPAFKEAPYYDPAALMNDRIIIAAFNTGRDLPAGRTRIATVHLQILGDAQPEYQLALVTAADADGQNIPAVLNLQTGENQ
jgi:hypothetical protein